MTKKRSNGHGPHFNVCIEQGPTFVKPALAVVGIKVTTYSDAEKHYFLDFADNSILIYAIKSFFGIILKFQNIFKSLIEVTVNEPTGRKRTALN